MANPSIALSVAERAALDHLESLKHELMERSRREGKLLDLGTLSGGENEQLWNQGEKAISLNRRKASGEISDAEEAEAFASLDLYFVPVVERAAKRCVDGSTIEGYDDGDVQWYSRKLGPQIQGGTAEEAYIYRLKRAAERPDETATLVEDIEKVAGEHNSRFTPGDHTDNHATDENCGCGAVGGLRRKIAAFADPKAVAVAEALADNVAGTAEQLGAVRMRKDLPALQRGAAALAARHGYVPERQMDVIEKLLELNPDGAEKLVRPHGEISVTLNFIKNTTFHRDAYNARTNGKLQNFNLDVWSIVEEYGEEGYALVFDAIQTLMDLTDGSLRVFARVPRAEAESSVA